MAGSNQDFFGNPIGSINAFLPSIANEINKIADSIEEHSNTVSLFLRETLQSSPWLPDSIKPPPPPPHTIASELPLGYLESSQDWISKHRAVTAAIVAFVGTGVFIIWRQRKYDRSKRRAKRTKNGSKTEVVILAGSPHSPLTQSLSLDLERRGFIVYIPVSSVSEEHLVQSESRADIRPLHMDITSPSSTTETINKFTTHLLTPQAPHATLPNAPTHTLHLSSLLLLPSAPGLSTHPTSPIATLTATAWSDTLNTHLLAPFTTLQAFLPLLTTQKSSLLFLTPTIIPSLTPPYHAPQSVVAGATQNYIHTLRKEVKNLNINIVQLKLGTFDYGTAAGAGRELTTTHRPPFAETSTYQNETLSWNPANQARFAKEYVSKMARKEVKGSPLRQLHNVVFDAIVRGKAKGGTVFVGRGSWMYDFVGRWVPGGVVGWMLGGRSEGLVVDGATAVEGSAEWEEIKEYESVYS